MKFYDFIKFIFVVKGEFRTIFIVLSSFCVFLFMPIGE